MMKFIKSLLGSQSNTLSSKRFCGLLGWVVLLVCLTVASINATELPGCITEFIFGTVTLLGVDSVTSIWKGNTSGKKSNPKSPGGGSPRGGGRKPKKISEEIRESVEEEIDGFEPGDLNNAQL